ncbi:hypothetical protein LCGC14_1547930 [marine sediment metagenome]|uniref:Uncharacterized protein n=1 Tax=marine sediment metagenome TaxID=412755 RepID=A0A0F9JC60_9ZZZZ
MSIDVEYKISGIKTKITVEVDNLQVVEAFTLGKDKVLIIKDLIDDMAPLPEAKPLKDDTKDGYVDKSLSEGLNQPSVNPKGGEQDTISDNRL